MLARTVQLSVVAQQLAGLRLSHAAQTAHATRCQELRMPPSCDLVHENVKSTADEQSLCSRAHSSATGQPSPGQATSSVPEPQCCFGSTHTEQPNRKEGEQTLQTRGAPEKTTTNVDAVYLTVVRAGCR
jgi:hypothetical protein